MKQTLLFFLILVAVSSSKAQDIAYKTETNVHYYDDEKSRSDAYINERCILDIYFPLNKEGFSTIVWFHGGGLTQGNKEIPDALKNKGVCVIGVNYRLSPEVKSPKYVEDAAAAVAWTIKNINRYGGDSTLVFVSGHSAGGYLASMIGVDKRWLARHQVDANQIAGLIPFSGHAITHFTIRKENGIPDTQPVIDDMAPLYHVRPDAPALLLITGDRELEMLGRYEENAYFQRMMKVAGHDKSRLYELDGYGHGMTEPAFPLLLSEVERVTRLKKEKP